MHLVQLFLPLNDNNHQPFPRAHFDAVRTELTERFGGVTAFVRSPAVGLWKEPGDEVLRNDVVLVEVMVGHLDRSWWSRFRESMEKTFCQEKVLIRASAIEEL